MEGTTYQNCHNLLFYCLYILLCNKYLDISIVIIYCSIVHAYFSVTNTSIYVLQGIHVLHGIYFTCVNTSKYNPFVTNVYLGK